MKAIRMVFIVVITGLLYLGVKTWLLPHFPNVSINVGIKGILTKLELTAFFVLIGSFVMEEIIRWSYIFLPPMEGEQNESGGTRWLDLLYVLLLVFGSGGFLIAISKIGIS